MELNQKRKGYMHFHPISNVICTLRTDMKIDEIT